MQLTGLRDRKKQTNKWEDCYKYPISVIRLFEISMEKVRLNLESELRYITLRVVVSRYLARDVMTIKTWYRQDTGEPGEGLTDAINIATPATGTPSKLSEFQIKT